MSPSTIIARAYKTNLAALQQCNETKHPLQRMRNLPIVSGIVLLKPKHFTRNMAQFD
jgi:hypothetical protein